MMRVAGNRIWSQQVDELLLGRRVAQNSSLRAGESFHDSFEDSFYHSEQAFPSLFCSVRIPSVQAWAATRCGKTRVLI